MLHGQDSRGIQPGHLPMSGKPRLQATVPSMPSSLVLRCANWDVIKFLIEELQHHGQNRRKQCLSSAAQSQPALSKVSPTLSSAPCLWASARRGKRSAPPLPNPERRCCEAGRTPLPCPPRGTVAPVLEAEAFLAQAGLLSWRSGLVTQGSLFPHPFFRQITSALLGRAIK